MVKLLPSRQASIEQRCTSQTEQPAQMDGISPSELQSNTSQEGVHINLVWDK